jgi:ribosomal protein L12E/L44/L45/RPP1/RPP2
VLLSVSSTMSTSELAMTYAALILHDDGVPVTADKLAAIVKAAGVTVEPYWPGLFAKFLDSKDMGDLIANVGSGASTRPDIRSARRQVGVPYARAGQEHAGMVMGVQQLQPRSMQVGCATGREAFRIRPWVRSGLRATHQRIGGDRWYRNPRVSLRSNVVRAGPHAGSGSFFPPPLVCDARCLCGRVRDRCACPAIHWGAVVPRQGVRAASWRLPHGLLLEAGAAQGECAGDAGVHPQARSQLEVNLCEAPKYMCDGLTDASDVEVTQAAAVALRLRRRAVAARPPRRRRPPSPSPRRRRRTWASTCSTKCLHPLIQCRTSLSSIVSNAV